MYTGNEPWLGLLRSFLQLSLIFSIWVVYCTVQTCAPSLSANHKNVWPNNLIPRQESWKESIAKVRAEICSQGQVRDEKDGRCLGGTHLLPWLMLLLHPNITDKGGSGLSLAFDYTGWKTIYMKNILIWKRYIFIWQKWSKYAISNSSLGGYFLICPAGLPDVKPAQYHNSKYTVTRKEKYQNLYCIHNFAGRVNKVGKKKEKKK